MTTNFLANFETSRILNATLIVSDYFGTGKRNNITRQFDSTNSSHTLTYDAATRNFNLCFKENGISLYPYLDTSKSNGYLEIYYKVDQFTNGSANPNPEMTIYFQ